MNLLPNNSLHLTPLTPLLMKQKASTFAYKQQSEKDVYIWLIEYIDGQSIYTLFIYYIYKAKIDRIIGFCLDYRLSRSVANQLHCDNAPRSATGNIYNRLH